MIWNRREFLKAGGLTTLGLGLNLFSPAFLQRRLLAGPADGEKKLIFIFQRGGNDGINTVIPRGDPEYSLRNRPTLFIPEGQAIDLGNGFAQLNPRMAPIMEIYNSQALTGVDGPGNLAILHRIGYRGQSQSHFDSQQFWENGVPGDPSLEEGMLYRKVINTLNPEKNRLAAAAISGSQMVALKGAQALPTLRNPSRYTFAGNPAKVSKFLGQLPSAPLGADGKGILGLYGGPRDFSGKRYRDIVYGTGTALADSMAIVQSAVNQGPYIPENGAVYPGGSFGDKLETVAMLLKRTPVRILGLNIGGFDTHTKQGQINGGHGDRMYRIALGYQALYRDLQAQWGNLVIVTMTEFGRTSRENGSFGTDHAYATVMFCAGGGVRGGVYNCDPQTWRPGDMFSVRDRYLERKTDFRAVFGEIFMRFFGDSLTMVNTVIPGYNRAASERPNDFRSLGFIV